MIDAGWIETWPLLSFHIVTVHTERKAQSRVASWILVFSGRSLYIGAGGQSMCIFLWM